MYPNPQDALPLPLRPDLEHYRKRAKDLVRACKSAESDAIRAWAIEWLEALNALQGAPDRPEKSANVMAAADDIAAFARAKFQAAPRSERTCRLADAQFIIARAHGFASWPRLADHIESLARANSDVSAFEAAAEAIVSGDMATLERLLQAHPLLVRQHSTREHGATLLHYVSANGVENYRQKSPQNAAAITERLLRAGVEIDAAAEVYHGHCTALALVATSGPPAVAGVQRDVIDVLLAHGARMDLPGMGGNDHALIHACLANGQPEAAKYLAERGAPLDLPGAAGLGRVDALDRLVPTGSIDIAQPPVATAFALACAYGRTQAVAWFLAHGLDADVRLAAQGEQHTGLHVASYNGHVDVVRLLLRHGARVDRIDETWRTPPLLWALTGWTDAQHQADERYYQVVSELVAGGAHVSSETRAWAEARADARMLAALSGR
jgi:Ankyrin repeats (3 copies)